MTRHSGCRLTALSPASEIIRDGLCGNGRADVAAALQVGRLGEAAAALDGVVAAMEG